MPDNTQNQSATDQNQSSNQSSGNDNQSQSQTQQTGQQSANGTAQVTGQQSQGQQTDKTGADQTTYTDFKLPEGVELDKELQTKFVDVARGLKLTQEQAQSLVTLQAEAAQARAKAQDDAWKAVNDDWVKQAKEDKDFGGLKFDESNKLARHVIETFVTKEEIKQFDEDLAITGMGNHPVLRKLLVRVGKKMSEDTMSNSGHSGNSGQPTDLAHKLYPNMA